MLGGESLFSNQITLTTRPDERNVQSSRLPRIAGRLCGRPTQCLHLGHRSRSSSLLSAIASSNVADTAPESYGVYLAYYIDCNHFAGATPLDYAFIGGIELGSALPIAPLCTILTRELGRVAVMSAGVLMFARGFIAASFASKIWHLYLKQGLLVGLGIGCLFIPATAVVPQWFLRRRSLVCGLLTRSWRLGLLCPSKSVHALHAIKLC